MLSTAQTAVRPRSPPRPRAPRCSPPCTSLSHLSRLPRHLFSQEPRAPPTLQLGPQESQLTTPQSLPAPGRGRDAKPTRRCQRERSLTAASTAPLNPDARAAAHKAPTTWKPLEQPPRRVPTTNDISRHGIPTVRSSSRAPTSKVSSLQTRRPSAGVRAELRYAASASASAHLAGRPVTWTLSHTWCRLGDLSTSASSGPCCSYRGAMRPRRPSRCGGSGHLESYAVRRARWPFQAVGFGPRGAPERCRLNRYVLFQEF